jgi:hypothetical protein
MWRVALATCLAAASLLELSGCAGLARGVTEGVMGRRDTEAEDTRQCHVRGPAFDGLEAAMRREQIARGEIEAPRASLKVLMVHGIGSHMPGYATRLAENLARALGLTRTERRFKEFTLATDSRPGEELGSLRVTRFVDVEDTRELLFYELTWDSIVEEEKQTLAFDSSGEHSFRRAPLNNAMKLFINDTVPDVMIYQGTSREPIMASVGISMCWMFSRDWQSLPADSGPQICGRDNPRYLGYLEDDYAFITHSLGSRIMTDALQALPDVAIQAGPEVQERLANILNRRLPVFMLSNQLPLLQLGQPAPGVYGQIDELCTEDFDPSTGRLFKEIAIIAFSDPNDVMSYSIPQGYLDEHVDSRICPSLVNVVLNVAEIINLFGVGQFANPLTAHSAYDNDERVIGLITQGIGNDHVDPEVAERCEWIETF